MKALISIIFTFLIASSSFAQVSVSLDQPPPYQFHTEDLWKVTLTNLGETSNVYLFGSVTKGTSKVVDATTSVFSLPPGVKRVNAQALSPIDIEKYSDEVERTLNSTGTFESGTYTICVSVISAETNQELGSYCNDYEIINMTKMELLLPMQDEEILLRLPNFNWLPPAPLPPGKDISYQFQLVDILNRQSPEYAFLSNPVYFQSDAIRTTLFQYPLAAKPLINGRRYAWRVITYLNNVPFLESEIWNFTYNGTNNDVTAINRNIEDQIEEDLSYWDSGSIMFRSSGNTNFNSRNDAAKDKPFEIGVSMKSDYEHNDKQAINSELPRNFGSFTLDPTISIYGIPFNLDLYFDTQQEEFKQNINSFGFLFDPSSLKSKLEEEINKKRTELENKLRQQIENEVDKMKGSIEDEIDKRKNEIDKKVNSSISPVLKIFSYFENLGLGETYPNYTKNTVNGVKMTGADLSFNPGLLYFAISGLNNLDAIPGSTFSRKMIAGSIGVGGRDESHFHINVLKAWDDQNSIDMLNLPSTITPKDNVVLGMDFSMGFLKDQLKIKAEVDGSMLTRDKTAPDLIAEDFPGFLKNILEPKISSQFDFMYDISSNFKSIDFGTSAELSFKSVGPGYVSLGAPNVRQDVQSIKFKVSHPFADKKILATIYFKQDKNNIAKLNSTTSTSTGFGFNVKIAFKDAPYFVIDYRPNSISNDAAIDSLSFENNSNVFTLITGLNQNDKKYVNSTNIMFSSISSSSKTGLNDYSILNFNLSNSLTFIKFPLVISGSAGYTRNNAVDSRSSFSFDLSGAYTFFEKWTNTLGASYYGEADANTKSSLYLNSSYSVGRYFSINLNILKDFYREVLTQYGEYDNMIIRLGASSYF